MNLFHLLLRNKSLKLLELDEFEFKLITKCDFVFPRIQCQKAYGTILSRLKLQLKYRICIKCDKNVKRKWNWVTFASYYLHQFTVSTCNVSFLNQQNQNLSCYFVVLFFILPVIYNVNNNVLFFTGWRMRAQSWCRLPPCWKLIHTPFLLGITSSTGLGASCPVLLTCSWPLMKQRYLFMDSFEQIMANSLFIYVAQVNILQEQPVNQIFRWIQWLFIKVAKSMTQTLGCRPCF